MNKEMIENAQTFRFQAEQIFDGLLYLQWDEYFWKYANIVILWHNLRWVINDKYANFSFDGVCLQCSNLFIFWSVQYNLEIIENYLKEVKTPFSKVTLV